MIMPKIHIFWLDGRHIPWNIQQKWPFFYVTHLENSKHYKTNSAEL